MVTVTYRPNKHELKLKGHAEYGEYGTDIVCASISTVFYNLCAMLREYDSEAFTKPLQMKEGFKGGISSVVAYPKAQYEQTIDHDFLYCLKGFEMIQGNYPECLNLKILER